MKILLVQPDASTELIGWGDLGAIAEPLALEYLAAGVRHADREVRLLDLRLHHGALSAALDDFAPDVVGVTGYSMHVLRNIEICQQVKARRPDCVTVVGGHHATLLPEDYFVEAVDCVVVGEGAGPFGAIVAQLERGARRPVVAGVWTQTAPGDFVLGAAASEFDVDAIPVPDRSIAPDDRASYYIDWMRPIALLRSTVGCPYRCSFCSLWRIMDGHYYRRDIDRVVEELASIEEDYVFFVDDEAFVGKKRMTDLADAIERSGIDKQYFTYCRIDTLIRFSDLLERWHRIGLERLFIGIEAITNDQLTLYNKKLEVAQVERGLQIAKEIGIKVFAGFIVNPRFTRRDFDRLERFIEHNAIEYPSFTILTPLPGTDALTSFDHITARQPNGRPDWSKFDLQHPVTETRLPMEEFMEHYRGLRSTFSSSYAEHRDLRELIRARRAG